MTGVDQTGPDTTRWVTLALDGAKRPCKVRTSNAGQLLFTGMVQTDRARRVAADLMSQKFFSGWGIRTVARGRKYITPEVAELLPVALALQRLLALPEPHECLAVQRACLQRGAKLQPGGRFHGSGTTPGIAKSRRRSIQSARW